MSGTWRVRIAPCMGIMYDLPGNFVYGISKSVDIIMIGIMLGFGMCIAIGFCLTIFSALANLIESMMEAGNSFSFISPFGSLCQPPKCTND